MFKRAEFKFELKNKRKENILKSKNWFKIKVSKNDIKYSNWKSN